MAGAEAEQGRLLERTAFFRTEAPGAETAPGRRVNSRRQLTSNSGHCQLLAGRNGVGLRHRVQEPACVGVGRVLVDLVGRPQFDELAQVHDTDCVDHVPHYGQVVGDEDEGQMVPSLKVFHQVEDLSLDRDVQSGHGFVSDDELGIEGQRPGQPDALALPAGELVRVPVYR